MKCYLAINGEILNIKYLARKYKINFDAKNSYLKIIIELFSRYGFRNIINEFEGIFSGIYIDFKNNTSIVFRDRFGIKPIYYFQKKDLFLVSSEINAILPFLDKAKQNINIVRDFIIEGNIDHTDETFFKDIFQLSSGCLISIDNIKLTFEKFTWYEKYLYIEKSDLNYLDAKDQLDFLMLCLFYSQATSLNSLLVSAFDLVLKCRLLLIQFLDLSNLYLVLTFQF